MLHGLFHPVVTEKELFFLIQSLVFEIYVHVFKNVFQVLTLYKQANN